MGKPLTHRFIEQHEQDIFKLLETIVNMDSYTHDREMTNKVADVLCHQLKTFQIPYERRSNDKFGDHIIARVKGTKRGKILLLGHYDTVHPTGTVKKRPYKVKGNRAYGPGLSDMKAGIVSMIYAAAAIKRAQVDLCDVELLMTPDEEFGSPVSRSIIEERAKDAIAVFNLESGRPDGSVVTSRRGSAHFSFVVEGKASHSGVAIEEGISAIEELAYKIIEIKKLNDFEKGRSLNVGIVEGGTNTNVVAAKATGGIHVGYSTNDDFAKLKDELNRIFANSYIPGTKSVLAGGEGILPMEKHAGVTELYNIVKEAADNLGVTISERAERGAADAGFVASLGIPVICAMGPVGGKWHSVDEYMEIDSYIPRIKLLIDSIELADGKMQK